MEPKKPFSPIEVRNRIFKRSVWGYNVQEVSEFLDTVGLQMEKALRQEKELTDKLRLLQEEVDRWKGRETEVLAERDRLLAEAEAAKAKAQEEAGKILQEVEDRANDIRRRTESWLETVLAQVEETERRRSNFITAFRSALDSHYELLREEQKPVEPIAAQLSQFLKNGESRLPS